jgi:hypothetical protein
MKNLYRNAIHNHLLQIRAGNFSAIGEISQRGGFTNMKKADRFRALLLAFMLVFAVGISLAKTSGSASNPQTNPKAMHQQAKAEHSKKGAIVLAAPENLSGTIAAVNLSDEVISLTGTNGVPYDFRVNRRTRMEMANQKVTLSELANDVHDRASIHFVPQSNGNRAETIQVKAS